MSGNDQQPYVAVPRGEDEAVAASTSPREEAGLQHGGVK